ncbi:MAG: glycosyltransferase family 4 protein [Gemmatimonadota bacterium]
MKTVRLLILTESFYPLGGGVGTYGLALSQSLVPRGVSVRVVTRRQSDHLLKREVVDGVEIVRLPPAGLGRLGKYLAMFPLITYLIRSRKEYDIVYVWGLRILGVVGVIAARVLGKPVALRAEQTGEISGTFMWQDRTHRPGLGVTLANVGIWLRDRILIRADRFVAISSAIEDEFDQARFPRERLIRIPNAVDLVRFRPNPSMRGNGRLPLGLPARAFLFLYSGRLHRHKGLLTLLEAWRKVATREKSAHLVLVGENSPNLGVEDELRRYVTRHLCSDTVTFAGQQSDVLPYLQAADAFVLPSQREGLSIALLEAMACELPAVGTRTSGTVELIRPGENGFLVNIGDVEGMTRAMLAMLADRAQARTMGANARALVEREYGLEVAATRHLALLAQLKRADPGAEAIAAPVEG